MNLLHSSEPDRISHRCSNPVSFSNPIPASVTPSPVSKETHSHEVKSTEVTSHFSPWLMPLAYSLGHFLVLPGYFKKITIFGQELLPREGPVILAPTHRSRWDALMIPRAAGYYVTGRHLHFMVTSSEVVGFQGWLIRQTGGFPVDLHQPTIASLRHGIEILQKREAMVIFPEGGIFREPPVQPLKPGLARLAIQAESLQPGLGVQVVPIALNYSEPIPGWRSSVRVDIGTPLKVGDYNTGGSKQRAQQLTTDLTTALKQLVDRQSEG